MAVDASGNLTADRDARSTDFTGMVRDRIRKIGTTAGQTHAELIGHACEELRTHSTEVIVRAGYAVPVAAWKAIRREVWDEALATSKEMVYEMTTSRSISI
jgi:hypothetical protein